MTADFQDLSARVEQLARERDQYVDFFEQSPEAYVVTDAQGMIVEANGAAVDVLQRRRAQLKGASLAGMVALERRKEFRERMQRVPGRWRTIFEVPGLRTDVTVSARPIERGAAVAGVCWLLQAEQ